MTTPTPNPTLTPAASLLERIGKGIGAVQNFLGLLRDAKVFIEGQDATVTRLSRELEGKNALLLEKDSRLTTLLQEKSALTNTVGRQETEIADLKARLNGILDIAKPSQAAPQTPPPVPPTPPAPTCTCNKTPCECVASTQTS